LRLAALVALARPVLRDTGTSYTMRIVAIDKLLLLITPRQPQNLTHSTSRSIADARIIGFHDSFDHFFYEIMRDKFWRNFFMHFFPTEEFPVWEAVMLFLMLVFLGPVVFRVLEWVVILFVGWVSFHKRAPTPLYDIPKYFV